MTNQQQAKREWELARYVEAVGAMPPEARMRIACREALLDLDGVQMEGENKTFVRSLLKVALQDAITPPSQPPDQGGASERRSASDTV